METRPQPHLHDATAGPHIPVLLPIARTCIAALGSRPRAKGGRWLVTGSTRRKPKSQKTADNIVRRSLRVAWRAPSLHDQPARGHRETRDGRVEAPHALRIGSPHKSPHTAVLVFYCSPSSDVQSVRLSRSSCMMSVESLYDSSSSVSSSAMASSKARLASSHASLLFDWTSYRKTE